MGLLLPFILPHSQHVHCNVHMCVYVYISLVPTNYTCVEESLGMGLCVRDCTCDLVTVYVKAFKRKYVCTYMCIRVNIVTAWLNGAQVCVSIKTACIYMYMYMYIYACVFLSRRGCLYIYTIVCILVQLIHVHLHVHNSILLLSPFLRLSLLSLFPFLSLMLVCYIFHVYHFACSCHLQLNIPAHYIWRCVTQTLCSWFVVYCSVLGKHCGPGLSTQLFPICCKFLSSYGFPLSLQISRRACAHTGLSTGTCIMQCTLSSELYMYTLRVLYVYMYILCVVCLTMKHILTLKVNQGIHVPAAHCSYNIT